jgi:hypothetical protein
MPTKYSPTPNLELNTTGEMPVLVSEIYSKASLELHQGDQGLELNVGKMLSYTFSSTYRKPSSESPKLSPLIPQLAAIAVLAQASRPELQLRPVMYVEALGRFRDRFSLLWASWLRPPHAAFAGAVGRQFLTHVRIAEVREELEQRGIWI